MSLSVSPVIWQEFIDKVFKNIANQGRYKVVMHNAMISLHINNILKIYPVVVYLSNLQTACTKLIKHKPKQQAHRIAKPNKGHPSKVAGPKTNRFTIVS